MRTLRYWMVGHGGFYNRGCEAIVRGSLEMLRVADPDAEVTLFSRRPEQDAAAQRCEPCVTVRRSLPPRARQL